SDLSAPATCRCTARSWPSTTPSRPNSTPKPANKPPTGPGTPSPGFMPTARPSYRGRRGCPRFQHHCRSVEYKVTGWNLEPDGRHLTLTDGHGMRRLRLVSTRKIEAFLREQAKQVRVLRRADWQTAGY